MARKTKMDVKAIAINALALSGGAAASGLVDGLLLSKISGGALDPKVKGLIKVAAGAVVPPFLAKGKGGGFIEKFGDGMIAIGGYQLLHAVLPSMIPGIAGIGGNINSYPPVIPMNGVGAMPLPTVSGDLNLSTVSGVGEGEDPDPFE